MSRIAGARFLAGDRGAFEHISNVSGMQPEKEFSLDSRETDILRGVARGHTNAEIGRSLGLDAAHISSSIRAISVKIGTADRNSMAAWAQRNGWT